MSSWYEFEGTLTFASEAAALAALAKLRSDTECLFWQPEHVAIESTDLVVRGCDLIFDDANFCGGESFYRARALLGQLVESAVAGRVRVQDGSEKEGNVSVSWYGFAPKRAAAKKKSTKKPRPRRPRARRRPPRQSRTAKRDESPNRARSV